MVSNAYEVGTVAEFTPCWLSRLVATILWGCAMRKSPAYGEIPGLTPQDERMACNALYLIADGAPVPVSIVARHL